jgi:hypothetical protein
MSTSKARTTESVSGSSSLNCVPSRARGDAHQPAHLPDHLLHHVQPDTPARKMRHIPLHRETGQEQEFEQFALAQRSAVSGPPTARDHGGADLLGIDAAPVVGHHDLKRPA